MKKLQTVAFSILPLGLNTGWAVGPILGGLAANPYHVEPGKPHGDRFLERYPYALPNLIATVFFLFSLFIVFFGFRESLESKKGELDYGILLKERFVAVTSGFYNKVIGKSGEDGNKEEDELETAPLLSDQNSLPPAIFNVAEVIPEVPENPPSATWKQVLDRQTVMCIISYGFLSMHSSSYDSLISVFMHHAKQDPSSPQMHLPFKFNGGFGSGTFHISGTECLIAKSTYRYHRNRSRVHHLRVLLHVHSLITCRYPQPIFSRPARLPVLMQRWNSTHLFRYSFHNPSPQSRKLYRA